MEVSRMDCHRLMVAERKTQQPVDGMVGEGLARIGFNEGFDDETVEVRLLHWRGVNEAEMSVSMPAEAMDTLATMWLLHRVLELPNDERVLAGLSGDAMKWMQKLAELATAKIAYWGNEAVADGDDETEALVSMHTIVTRVAQAWQVQAEAQAEREWSRRDGRSRIVE